MGVEGQDKAEIFEEYFGTGQPYENNDPLSKYFVLKDCKRRIGKVNFCRYFKSPCELNDRCVWKKNYRFEHTLRKIKKLVENYPYVEIGAEEKILKMVNEVLE